MVNPSNTENTNAKQFLAKTKSNHHVQGAHKMAAVILVRDGGKKKKKQYFLGQTEARVTNHPMNKRIQHVRTINVNI